MPVNSEGGCGVDERGHPGKGVPWFLSHGNGFGVWDNCVSVLCTQALKEPRNLLVWGNGTIHSFTHSESLLGAYPVPAQCQVLAYSNGPDFMGVPALGAGVSVGIQALTALIIIDSQLTGAPLAAMFSSLPNRRACLVLAPSPNQGEFLPSVFWEHDLRPVPFGPECY